MQGGTILLKLLFQILVVYVKVALKNVRVALVRVGSPLLKWIYGSFYCAWGKPRHYQHFLCLRSERFTRIHDSLLESTARLAVTPKILPAYTKYIIKYIQMVHVVHNQTVTVRSYTGYTHTFWSDCKAFPVYGLMLSVCLSAEVNILVNFCV